MTNFIQKWRKHLLLEKSNVPNTWQCYVDLVSNKKIDRTAILTNLRAKCGITVVRVIPGTSRQGDFREEALIKIKFRPAGESPGEADRKFKLRFPWVR